MIFNFFQPPHHLGKREAKLILSVWLSLLLSFSTLNLIQQQYGPMLLSASIALSIATALLVFHKANSYWPVVISTCLIPALGSLYLPSNTINNQLIMMWSFPIVMMLYVFARPKTALIINIFYLCGLIIVQSLHTEQPWLMLPRLAIAHITMGGFLFFFTFTLQKQHIKLTQYATHDELTQLPNRRELNRKLQEWVALKKRKNEISVSLAILDIDHFKSLNDKFGHGTGDKVLQAFAKVIQSKIRKTDFFARYGGEEFVLILPTTELYGAVRLLNNLHKNTQALSFLKDHPVMFSAGVCELERGLSPNQWLECGDKALYVAKHSGRNCTKAYMEENWDSDYLAPESKLAVLGKTNQVLQAEVA
jgi:diguanylate cyclase (GGDEF)-like protein